MKNPPLRATPVAAPLTAVARHIGRYRWKICALLFFATTVNYIDRQVLGILAPELQTKLGWNEAQYGYIVTAFQAAYAMSLLISGRVMDRIGTRKGYSIAVLIWSSAAMAHSLARSAFGFGLARFALGIGEAGNFPAAIKTVAEWFPRKERALAIGIFNSGSNIGALVAPLTIPWLAIHLGWQSAFLATGFADLIWLMFWLKIYRKPAEHPKLSSRELEYIQSDPISPPVQVGFLPLLRQRQTWAFILGKFLTDPVWWFYLFWLPKFLTQIRDVPLSKIGLPLAAVYLAADFGSIAGGGLSGFLLKRNWSANSARKTSLLVCACCAVPVLFIPHISSLWGVVAVIALATAGHQGWSANLFALVPDLFPQQAAGSVTGIGGTGGALGGMLIAFCAGLILQATESYFYLFLFAGSAYLVALLMIQLLAPSLTPVHLKESN